MNKEILHQRALEIVGRYAGAEADLLEILQQLDAHKVYREHECPSLFVYAVKILRLSESTAYNFITVARKAREVPELKMQIAAGELSVAKARKITPVLTRQNQEEWLGKAKTLPQKMLEKEVARVAPKAGVAERASYLSESRMQLTLAVEEKLMTRLRRAQDLVSRSGQRAVTLEETLDLMVEAFLEQNDPVRKAERAQRRSPKPVARQVESAASAERGRKLLPAALRHAIAKRDGDQCTHADRDGNRCSSARWLDLHHITPVNAGGPDTLENLTTLCRGHHQMSHAS